MNRLSLNPDNDMKWIYDPRHPDYHSDMARDLRERRSRAIASAPQWMRLCAALAAHEEGKKP